MEKENEGDLFSCLSQLPLNRIGNLFECRWSCLGVLRRLTPAGRALVMRLLFFDEPVGRDWLQRNASGSSGHIAVNEAFSQLRALKVLEEEAALQTTKEEIAAVKKKGKKFLLHPMFANQLKLALGSTCTNVLPWQDGLTSDMSRKGKLDLERLESGALGKWTAILHFIVGSKEFKHPGPRVVKLLLTMGLMRYGHSNARANDDDDEDDVYEMNDVGDVAMRNGNGSNGVPRITRRGYEFMLKDIHEQVWIFMQHYTKEVEAPEIVLSLLFRLSFCRPGTICSSSSLNETQKALLADFDLFGLVYREIDDSNRFYATSLGMNVVFGQSREQRMAEAAKTVDMPSMPAASAESRTDVTKKIKLEGIPQYQKPGKIVAGGNNVFIICETNFKVYAYTTSSLHVEMLRLFVTVECILPNIIVAVITRSSIRSAFKFGITAAQIIHFLTENAHPLCKQRHRLVPDNITDQIILWETERNRVVSTKGMCYADFSPAEESIHRLAVEHAKQNRWLIYHTAPPQPMTMVIEENKHEEMKAFIKEARSKS